jgi:hypothetical protein
LHCLRELERRVVPLGDTNCFRYGERRRDL